MGTSEIGAARAVIIHWLPLPGKGPLLQISIDLGQQPFWQLCVPREDDEMSGLLRLPNGQAMIAVKTAITSAVVGASVTWGFVRHPQRQAYFISSYAFRLN